VIETHTHADHVSSAAEMAGYLNAPLLMHSAAPSKRVSLRVSHAFQLPTHSGPLHFIPTPGHTSDGMCIQWGPFAFTGDTVLFGDVGRDDLPTGSPEDHHESLICLRSILDPFILVCPGHDSKGGRISSWGTQLQINSSLTQTKEDYVTESRAFTCIAPALFKESLFENFK
jgi:sulfur dioxygenase